MKVFIHDDFLLDGKAARRLYHDYAEGLPIVDYHSHVNPAHIADNTRFETITGLWLGGDHYKWRAMRAAGVPESHISGDAPDRDKFRAWAATVPRTLGNPLYHWTHLELKRVFGIDELLGPDSADRVYDRCNGLLARDEYRVRGIIRRFGVQALCSTDDPVDDLARHRALAGDRSFATRVLPSFRPDRAHALEDPVRYTSWIAGLEKATGLCIKGYDDLLAALKSRHDYFNELGCKLSDHGLAFVPARFGSVSSCDAIFKKARSGEAVSRDEVLLFRGGLLYELGVMDADKGWTMQLHLGAMRGVNSRMSAAIGPDSGFDVIGDWPQAEGLAALLDRLDSGGCLPRTILYTLNPRDNELFAAMTGAFQGGRQGERQGSAGRMQFGSGWWFNDQKDGMERQLTALASMGLLANFVGMLTDSRSFLSYPRHEYFRRVLCNLVGGWIDRGEMPDDLDLVGGLIKDISYRNAAAWFGLASGEPSD